MHYNFKEWCVVSRREAASRWGSREGACWEGWTKADRQKGTWAKQHPGSKGPIETSGWWNLLCSLAVGQRRGHAAPSATARVLHNRPHCWGLWFQASLTLKAPQTEDTRTASSLSSSAIRAELKDLGTTTENSWWEHQWQKCLGPTMWPYASLFIPLSML